MKTSSAKAKARLCQNWNHRLLHLLWPKLHEDDIVPRQMGGIGEDQVLSPAARVLIPCSIENKNQESTSPWAWVKQAKKNAKGWIPVVVFMRNRVKEPQAIVPAAMWFKAISLLTAEQHEMVRNFAYEIGEKDAD